MERPTKNMHSVSIITLPPSRWQEYRTLRLHALCTDPKSFARTYEEDADLSDVEWQKRLQMAQDGDLSCMFFAQHNGRLIGMVGALFSQGVRVQHCARVVSTYVMPEFRGQGIGTQLLQVLFDRLVAHPHIIQVKIEVVRDNDEARKAYEKMGAKVVGLLEKELCCDGIFYDVYLMIKILDKGQ